MNRNDRLTGILLALQGGRKTATQLAGRFEVSRRTILRDIDALSQIGVPVIALPGSGGGYEIADGFWLSPVQLTAEEASLLLLALKSLGPSEGSPFGLARLSVEEKLRAVLPEQVLKGAEHEVSAIEVSTPHRPERLGHLADLRQAVVAGHWVRIAYQSVRRTAQHELLPLKLYVDRGRWYCRALSLAAGEERTFRVDRMLTVLAIPTPDDAPPRADLDLTSPANNWHTVVVRLTNFALRTLEDHPDFGDDVHEDESGGWLRFDTPHSELDYFARELFALGPEATVLEPDILRDKIVALAEGTLSQYAKVRQGDR